MKKALILVVSLVLLFSMCACESSVNEIVKNIVPKPYDDVIEDDDAMTDADVITDDESRLLAAFGNQIGSDYLYFLPADYDNDGTLEAFVITGNQEDSTGLCSNVNIWFVDSNGKCGLVKDNTYGALQEPVKVSNGQFISWCVTAGGSGTNSIIVGCKNGQWFEPSVSGKYAGFGGRTMSNLFSDTNDFDELNCDYIAYYSYFRDEGGHMWDPIAFDYDPESREFIQRVVNNNDITNAYYELIKKANIEYDHSVYSLYDIDKDGTPELIIDDGESHNKRKATFYTYNNGSYYMGELQLGSIQLCEYPDGNGFVEWRAAKNYESLSLEQYINGEFAESVLVEGNSVVPPEEYRDPEEIYPGAYCLQTCPTDSDTLLRALLK